MWDERYSEPGHAYGTEPNGFLASVSDRVPGGRILCLGEGEGRNAVHLALGGREVVAVDASAVGLEKARRLATERGTAITTVTADLCDYTIEPDSWDGVVSIFCHLPPALRAQVHASAVAGLRPGGAFVLEGYTPRQMEFGTGGPRTVDLLMRLEDLEEELRGLRFLIARECVREVREGRYHTGQGAVVQVLGVKPGAGAGRDRPSSKEG